MIATWALSVRADPHEIGEKLRWAPFDCVVVVMSGEVTDSTAIWTYFFELASSNPQNDARLDQVLREKAVFRLNGHVFVALHKAKIRSCCYSSWSVRSRGSDPSIKFGTLRLFMDNTRQRMPEVAVGILHVRGTTDYSDVEALAEWIVQDRIAMLTGFFGNAKDFVQDLAREAGAIHSMPSLQLLQWTPTAACVTPPTRTRATSCSSGAGGQSSCLITWTSGQTTSSWARTLSRR